MYRININICLKVSDISPVHTCQLQIKRQKCKIISAQIMLIDAIYLEFNGKSGKNWAYYKNVKF